MSLPEPVPPPRRTAGAIALIVIGLLILIPSGLCTSIFMGGAFLDTFFSSQNSSAMGDAIPALIIGGPFVAIGAFLVWLGLRRPGKRQQ
ncbi:MAG TPA: hypothetical protein VGF97_05810 [Rhizomicrobium sp.]|jgi:hypothetical protein